MNKEIIKAMQNKPESKMHKVCAWWRKNHYMVFRVILFPLWAGIVIKDKINARLNANEEWSEERATEILNYYIPRRANWCEDKQCFYFFDNGMGWNRTYAKKFLKRKDRRFWKVNCDWWGGKMRDFMIEKFELEGFTKKVGDCWDGWTEITYYLNKQES